MKEDTIITHNGIAHVDDFLSCCVLLAKEHSIKKIIRLPSNKTTVDSVKSEGKLFFVDIGRQFNPKLCLFDHHQISNDLCLCSFNLLIKHYYNIDYNEQSKIIPQAAFIGHADTNGISNALKSFIPSIAKGEIDSSCTLPISSLIEFSILSWFASSSEVNSTELLFSLMKTIGDIIDNYITARKDFYKNISSMNVMSLGNDIYAIDMVIQKGFTDIIDAYFLERSLHPKILISRSSQNPKQWCATRRITSIDFRKCKSKAISFIHNTGFFIAFEENTQIDTIVSIFNIFNQKNRKVNNARLNRAK